MPIATASPRLKTQHDLIHLKCSRRTFL